MFSELALNLPLFIFIYQVARFLLGRHSGKRSSARRTWQIKTQTENLPTPFAEGNPRLHLTMTYKELLLLN